MARLTPVPRQVAHNFEVAHYREADAERHNTTATPTEAIKIRLMEWEYTGLYIYNVSGSQILTYDIQVACPDNTPDTEPAAAEFVSVSASTLAANGLLYYNITAVGGWARVMISCATPTTPHCRFALFQKRSG